MSKDLYVREWLNEDHGRGYIIIDCSADSNGKCSWVDAGLELGDCNRTIHLDFFYDTEEDRTKKLFKADSLIEKIIMLRDFISETPVPKLKEKNQKNNNVVYSHFLKYYKCLINIGEREMLRELIDEDLNSGDLLDIDEFIGDCLSGQFTDYDGFGYYVYEDEIDDGKNKAVTPSDIVDRTKDYPNEDVTHILWFNR